MAFFYSLLLFSGLLLYLGLVVVIIQARIPTTLDGPFEPVTAPFDPNLRGNAVDLPDSDPRVRRRVKGFEPEQISVSLSVNYDSVWISWITGFTFNYNFFFFISYISVC